LTPRTDPGREERVYRVSADNVAYYWEAPTTVVHTVFWQKSVI